MVRWAFSFEEVAMGTIIVGGTSGYIMRHTMKALIVHVHFGDRFCPFTVTTVSRSLKISRHKQ